MLSYLCFLSKKFSHPKENVMKYHKNVFFEINFCVWYEVGIKIIFYHIILLTQNYVLKSLYLNLCH